MPEVPKVTLRLSDEARAGLERGCVSYGVTITALVEAIGRMMLTDTARLGERGADIIELARQIDAERRSRGLDKP
jgi:hypothetical protein